MAERPYRKGFYRVGEVCTLTGLESHVLRYWESEFPMLRPRKSRGGQRLYRPQDIELILRIRALLQEEGYTIAGARRVLAQATEPARLELRRVLAEARHELRSILTLMRADDTL